MDNNKFIKMPTNLVYMLDSDCFKLMTILIQKESYWANKGKLKDGWFVKTIKEIKKELDYANTKEVGCVIQAMVNSGIINVTAYEKKRMSAKFKICWEKVNELNDMSLYDLNEFDFEPIRKLPRGSKITYNKNTERTQKSTQLSTKCNSTIYNINNIENKGNNTTTNSCITSNETTKDIAVECSSKVDSSTIKKVDPHTILNKLVCYINYDCPIGMIVQPIHTQVKCANQQLIALQVQLNDVIKQYMDATATEEVCKELWERLISIVFNSALTPTNKIEQLKYEEIVQGVNKIGYEIAYVCRRKALKNPKSFGNSAYYFLVNSVGGDAKTYIKYYLMWQIAEYTLSESVSDTDYLNLSKENIISNIAEKNESFKKDYKAWSSKHQKNDFNQL